MAECRPRFGERIGEIAKRRAAHRNGGVAPWLDAALGIAEPGATDADTADERDRVVDHEQLAMIAREPAERTRKSKRIVRAHLAAGFDQRLPEREARRALAAEPVANRSDADACRGAL